MSPDLKEMRELGDHLWEELSRQKEQPQTDVCPSSVRMESSVSQPERSQWESVENGSREGSNRV